MEAPIAMVSYLTVSNTGFRYDAYDEHQTPCVNKNCRDDSILPSQHVMAAFQKCQDLERVHPCSLMPVASTLATIFLIPLIIKKECQIRDKCSTNYRLKQNIWSSE